MSANKFFESLGLNSDRETRSHSAQGLTTSTSNAAVMIPLPPRLWITDVSDESSDEGVCGIKDDGNLPLERARIRSRYRHQKHRSAVSVPIGVFWDIENCQIPRGCSAIDVVSAIRGKFLTGRREADFVVVCDVRKMSTIILQELNDAQISLIHVCGTQKNAADEKLRQCMRRFGELHSSPAALLLISGDINFAAELSDFRHRKNMEVILLHKQNTSSALITCASSHFCYNELCANLPRKSKVSTSQDEEEQPTFEMEVTNLPMDQPPERVSRRLRRLADNCGGKILKVTAPTAILRFPSTDHAARALKRMDGEDVFGRKIGTRFLRGGICGTHAYSSDEGYSTAPPLSHQVSVSPVPLPQPPPPPPPVMPVALPSQWTLALQQLPVPPQPTLPNKPRKITGAHSSINLDRSGCSSSNSGDEGRRDRSQSRAMSPWNSSNFSEQSEGDVDHPAELTITNLPLYEAATLQKMLTQLFTQFVPLVKISVWAAGEGPLATVVLRNEWDARLAIARIHKRRLESQWAGRRLELSLGRPSPAPNLDVLRARLRAILLEQKNYSLPLLRLRDAYASRHCCALTTSDIAKVKDTVVIHEGFGRMVQLVDLSPATCSEMEEAPWRCQLHAAASTGHEDGSKILQPVYIEIDVLAKHVQVLLETHGGILPLLSFVECYEATFPRFIVDTTRGVPLEMLLRSTTTLSVRDTPSRHITWRTDELNNTPPSESSRSSGDRDRPRTAPVLEPMLALFERELIDLLRTAPRCTVPFSKLIPAFHHHFGRQCRVADYGFTKLPDLLAALSHSIVVLGSGSCRVITISATAQTRRWTTDLVKLLKSQNGRAIMPHDIPQLYQATFGRVFSPVDYGVCTVGELMQKVMLQSVTFGLDGTISLPRRAPTPEEKQRTVQFALQTVELLCYTPNLRMEFSRFVPAYHAHFGRQLRVAHYGCVKLVELLELIPETVSIQPEPSGERTVRLTSATSLAVMQQRFKSLTPISLENLPVAYASQYGAHPLPDIMSVSNLDELIYSVGGYIENGTVRIPGDFPQWVTGALAACSVLSSDRSVTPRGSSEEYFINAYKRLTSTEPDMNNLTAAGVVMMSAGRVRMAPVWRTVWRVVQILAEKQTPLTVMDVFVEYTKRFEPMFPCAELGFESIVEFMRKHSCVFNEDASMYWSICSSVSIPRLSASLMENEDYSVYDTPPGQKGSRVFDSPKTDLWCSPPASSLPTPTALLSNEKRRIRLAAHFEAV